jgi:hypothetical protein
MRIIISTLLFFLAVSSVAKAQNADVPRVSPFHISSLNTSFAMQGDFEGEYRVYPNRIEVKVTKADIRISERCPYKGHRLLSAVTFSLATSIDSKKWKIAYSGQGYSLERVMSSGDVVNLGELYFNIPIDESIDLSKYWLVVQMNDTVLDIAEEERVTGHAYAHSCRDIFSQPK